MRGNENNQHLPDGTYYLGPGTTPGYGVANAGARYQLVDHIRLFMQVNSLLDLHYYAAAHLATTGFNNQGNVSGSALRTRRQWKYSMASATFYAPGAPFGAWGGVRLSFKTFIRQGSDRSRLGTRAERGIN